jgi:exodeoxyribonuclease VII large subunit
MTPTFTVSDFIDITNQTLEYAFPSVLILGEVSSFKVNQGKFVFFDLKDSQTSIGCFMMVFQLNMPIEDGMKVVVVAEPKLTKWGKFSLTVKSIKPVGEGSLKKSFDLLKAKLDKEGLFDTERKRLLPDQPKRIGVISSKDAAGFKDFVKILDDRWGGMEVVVASVQVQGEKAPEQIINALRFFGEDAQPVEAIVITRGGGSADDLSVFNDERLVRAIASSRIPTLVAVGHEVDVTLADLVADVRAATPSNAAQILVPDKNEVISDLKNRLTYMTSIVNREIDTNVAEHRSWLSKMAKTSMVNIDRQFDLLNQQKTALRAYDPNSVLRHGYALIKGDLIAGGKISIETSKYIAEAEVINVKAK